MKKTTLLLAFLIFACQSPTKISEKEVMETFDTFFEVIDCINTQSQNTLTQHKNDN